MCSVITGQTEHLLSSNSQKPVMFKLDEVMYLHLEVVFISSDATMKFHGVLTDHEILRDLDIIGILSNIPDNGVHTYKPSLSPHCAREHKKDNLIFFFQLQII